MLKKLIKFFSILTILLIISDDKVKEIKYEIKTNKIIENSYEEDYITINYYKLLIKEGNEQEVLDNNFVYMLDNSDLNNIFLAGHNNNLVFNRIYKLKVNDIVYLNFNNKKYEYLVTERRYIKVNDVSIFNKNDSKNLILITCTNNNQKRYIVKCKIKK